MQTVPENIPSKVGENLRMARDRADLLRSRVSLLVGRDRLLMEMYLENGNTFRQLATLAGVSEARIARRIHKITRRLINGAYLTCLRNRDLLTPEELQIARDYFLLALPQKAIARQRGSTCYQVRKAILRIKKTVKVE